MAVLDIRCRFQTNMLVNFSSVIISMFLPVELRVVSRFHHQAFVGTIFCGIYAANFLVSHEYDMNNAFVR